MFRKLSLLLTLCSLFITTLPAHAADAGPIQRLGTGLPTAIAASPDGKTLAVGSSIGVWFVDAVMLKPIHFLDTQSWVKSVEYSADGQYLKVDGVVHDVVSGGVANVELTAITWLEHGCTADGKLCARAYGGHINVSDTSAKNKSWLAKVQIKEQFPSLDATLSPMGERLYGLVGNTIKLWDVSSTQILTQLDPFFTGGLRRIWWSPDGQKIASSSVSDCWQKVCGVRFSPNGVALPAPRAIWDITSAQIVQTDECWYGSYTCSWPVMTDWYDAIQIRNPNTGKVLKRFRPHHRALASADLSVDQNWIVTSGQDSSSKGSARVWDAKNFARLGEVPTRLYDVVFSPNALLVIGHSTTGLEVWDWQNKKQLWKANEAGDHFCFACDWYGENPQGVAVNPAGTLIASYAPSIGSSVHLYSLTSGELLATLSGHTAAITGVAFNPDGTKVAASSADGTVLIWAVP